jgi:predicted phage tail protein
MLDVINKNIANIGRGKVLRLGTRYGAVWDCVKQPVQMFGMGNIISGTFQEEFMETADRANAVEVTYMDADNNFNRETITIYSEDYDNAAVEKTAAATYDGITSYEQAYREGVYQLKCNQYLLRTCSFEANIDAIACTIGDLVMVAHDVPMWARSGRIYSVKGDVLTLPVQLEDTINTYRIMYRTVNDNLYTTGVEILSNADGWCEVRLAEMNDEDLPQKDDIFDLAIASVGSKPFIVKNITRAQDFTRKIECIEYNENVYSEDYDIPEPQYTDETSGIKNVTNLDGKRVEYMGANNILKYHMDLSWERASSGDFYIFTSADGVNYTQIAADITDTSYSADVSANTRWAKVVTGNGAIRSDGTIKKLTTISRIASLDITGLTVNVRGHNVYASWDQVSASNLDYYQVSLNGDSHNTNSCSYQFTDLEPGLYSLTVSAITDAGSEGPPVTHAIEIE